MIFSRRCSQRSQPNAHRSEQLSDDVDDAVDCDDADFDAYHVDCDVVDDDLDDILKEVLPAEPARCTSLRARTNRWMVLRCWLFIPPFLDTHVSLAPTHVCLSVRPSVGPSIGHTFGFPICQRLWSPYVKS